MTQKTEFVVKLEKGCWLDVLDEVDVWNNARILEIYPNKTEINVQFDGWPSLYDTVVTINKGRVAPYHTYTWSVKCWVKYKNWPWWPAIATIRTPGSINGIGNLRDEQQLFVDFCDHDELDKRCRTWLPISQIAAFDCKFDEKRSKTTGSDFENALARVLQSSATSIFPTFNVGTLPQQFSNTVTESVKTTKRRRSMELWVHDYMTASERHKKTHVYGSDNTENMDATEEEDVNSFTISYPSNQMNKSMLIVKDDIIILDSEDEGYTYEPENLAVNSQVDIPVSRQVDNHVPSQVDIPVASQLEFSVSSQVDIPLASQMDIPLTSQVDIPSAQSEFTQTDVIVELQDNGLDIPAHIDMRLPMEVDYVYSSPNAQDPNPTSENDSEQNSVEIIHNSSPIPDENEEKSNADELEAINWNTASPTIGDQSNVLDDEEKYLVRFTPSKKQDPDAVLNSSQTFIRPNIDTTHNTLLDLLEQRDGGFTLTAWLNVVRNNC